MGMFVDPNAKIAVTEGENTIYIRAKMDAGTRAAVLDEIRATGIKVRDEAEVRGLGSYRLLLLVHNIQDWEGPDFRDEKGTPIKCTREQIRRLDPTHPLFAKVAERIGELNAEPESPDPN